MSDIEPHVGSPLRVLAIIETLGIGGAEQALLNLLATLKQRGHECEVAVLWPPYTLAATFEAEGVPVHRLAVGHRFNLIGTARRLARLSRLVQPDVIQAQLFFAGLAAATSRPLDSRPRRLVVFHNLGYDSYPVNSLWRRAHRRANAIAMHYGMDAWVAVSKAVADHYALHLGLPNIRVIPNGLDIERLNREAHAATDASLPKSTLLLAGTFRHEKGHRFLLEAARRLRARGMTPRILFAGDGPTRYEVERQVIEMRLNEQVEFLGPLPHERLVSLMAAVDVVAMPSTHEGLPVTAMEAAAVGATIVASAVGGIPEIVEHEKTGLLVPPGDAEALAEALDRVFGDANLRHRLATAGQERAAALFGSDKVADAFEQLYAEMLER